MGLKIFLCLAVLISVFLLTWVRFIFIYDGELSVILKFGIFKKKLYPAKRKKINPNKYSREKIARLKEKEKKEKQRKAEKKAKKKAEKASEKAGSTAKGGTAKRGSSGKIRSIIEIVSLVRRLIYIILKKFFKYLRIDVARINIVAASGDAASTAVMFGAINAAVECLCELLSNIMNFNTNNNTEISVRADFILEKPEADIYISLRLRIWHLFSIAGAAAVTFIKEKLL